MKYMLPVIIFFALIMGGCIGSAGSLGFFNIVTGTDSTALTDGNVLYDVSANDGTAVVTGLDKSPSGTKDPDVVIPALISWNASVYTVTSIGTPGFNWAGTPGDPDNPRLTSVYLPDSVITIGSSAFNSNLLTDVYIPDNVILIRDLAFYSNPMTTASIPAGTAYTTAPPGLESFPAGTVITTRP